MLPHATANQSSARRRLSYAVAAIGIAAALTLHAALAIAATPPTTSEDAPAEQSQPSSVEFKVLRAAAGIVKEAEIAALAEKRQPLRLVQMLEAMGHPVNGDSLTEQETLASSSSARVENNILQASEFNLNLPEGSELKAIIDGRRVTVDQTDDSAVTITIEGGSMRIVDSTGVARVKAAPADGGQAATLSLKARMADGEVAFIASATWAGQSVPVRVELDLHTGVPAEEAQPPHGAIRWRLHSQDGQDPKPVNVKMQWIYNVNQIRLEAEQQQLEADPAAPAERQ
jgi:hypothetical protein